MRFLMPDNFFAQMMRRQFKDRGRDEVLFRDASMISNELELGNADIALIPSCDLIKHPDFFISSRVALSFDGILSNAFFYFIPGQNKFTDLYLKGDVTTNEIILSKILFKERYSSDIQIHLETGTIQIGERDYLVVGDYNFRNDNFINGLSYSDELSTLLFLPYVNFVIASRDKEVIEQFNETHGGIELDIDENSSDIFKDFNLSESAKKHIMENFNSVYFEATETEMEGLKELLLLPYYHGIMDEMVELKIF